MTDIIIDPRNPDILYCASWQRHEMLLLTLEVVLEHLYIKYRRCEKLEKINKGLPSSNMGKIGLAISPMNPDILYAAVETERRRAVYRSANSEEVG